MITTNVTNPALYTPSSSNMRQVNGYRMIEGTNVYQNTDFQQLFSGNMQSKTAKTQEGIATPSFIF